MSRITFLHAVGFKCIDEIVIDNPDPHVVILGGRNAQGKSATLDVVLAGLAGKKYVPDKPVKEGAKKSYVELRTETFRARRDFIKDKIEVTDQDGKPIAGGPQSFLDKLINVSSLNPTGFFDLDAKAQLAELRRIAGVDVTELNLKRDEIYQERTIVGRNKKTQEGLVAGLPHHPGAPKAEIDVAAEAAKLQEASARATARERLSERITAQEDHVKQIETQIAQLNRDLVEARSSVDALLAEYEALPADAIDIDEIQTTIQQAQEINAKVRANAARAEAEEALAAVSAEYDRLTEEIEAIDEQKRAMLEAAKFPVDGLSFDDDGVLYNGIPLKQASQREQIVVSTAIEMAKHPDLRVFQIRTGSLMDDDGMRVIAEMAEKHDCQVWIERVGRADAGAIVIEAGRVDTVNPKNEEPEQDDLF